MRLLIVASYSGSVVNFRGALIDSLIAAGIEVHVAVPGYAHDESLKNSLAHKGVTGHDYPLQRTGVNPLADLVSFFFLWRLAKNIRPDIVLAYTVKPVVYGALAARLARVPNFCALITGLGYAFQARSGRVTERVIFHITKNLYSSALKRAKVVFFQNPDDQMLFRSLNILPSSVSSCVVNGSGVDLVQYPFSLAPLAPRFLLIARLLGDKGVREYAEAARKVKSYYPDAVFSLVGWFDENPSAIQKDEVEAWVAEGTLKYLGRLEDVRSAIADCSVYVLPSYREGTPRTVLEALAMGRAVITTDAPGCRETVDDGENGFLVPVKDVNELAAAMLRFIDDPQLAVRMGQRSREIAEERYDVHSVNAKMLTEMGIQ